jgi:fatty acid/phospholipid biosynthesis enzyme
MFGNPDPTTMIVKKIEEFYNAMMATAHHHLNTAFDGEAPEMMKQGALKKAQQKCDAAKYAAEAAAGAAREVLSLRDHERAKALVHEADVMWQLCETELKRRRQALPRKKEYVPGMRF